MSSDLPRRTLLAGGGAFLAALLTGCSGDAPDPVTEAEHSDDARRLRRATEEDSAALLSRYDALLAAHPDLAEPLDAPRGAVAAHLAVLREQREADGDTADDAAGDGGPGTAPEIPSDAAAAVLDLAAAEEELAAARLATLADAPPELARLLASLAAAGAVHAHLLQEVSP